MAKKIELSKITNRDTRRKVLWSKLHKLLPLTNVALNISYFTTDLEKHNFIFDRNIDIEDAIGTIIRFFDLDVEELDALASRTLHKAVGVTGVYYEIYDKKAQGIAFAFSENR